MRPTMIFAPNSTGQPHVGNMIVGHFTAKEAERRGCDLCFRYDDTKSHLEGPRAKTGPEILAEKAVEESMALLGWYPKFTYTRTSKQPFYKQQARAFLESKEGKRAVNSPTLARVRDVVYGEHVEYSGYRPDYKNVFEAWVAICDFIELRTPLHIRGTEIIYLSIVEQTLFPMLKAWRQEELKGYPGLEYAHIPTIFITDLKNAVYPGWLSKTHDPPHRFNFLEWVEGFRTVKARRRGLEKMVCSEYIKDPMAKDILPMARVWLTPEGGVSHYEEMGPLRAEQPRRFLTMMYAQKQPEPTTVQWSEGLTPYGSPQKPEPKPAPEPKAKPKAKPKPKAKIKSKSKPKPKRERSRGEPKRRKRQSGRKRNA